MSQIISGVGTTARLIASVTYTTGIQLSQFADDVDPFDLASTDIQDSSKGLNADLLIWKVNNKIPLVLAFQPDSQDDKNLAALLALNRAELGRPPITDIITLVAFFPDGSVCTLLDGAITGGMPGTSIASSGRKKTKTYTFAFRTVANL